jgi:hypothetical protein
MHSQEVTILKQQAPAPFYDGEAAAFGSALRL